MLPRLMYHAYTPSDSVSMGPTSRISTSQHIGIEPGMTSVLPSKYSLLKSRTVRNEPSVVDTVDDISCAAKAELPLVCKVVAQDYVYLDAEQRACAMANRHNHVGQEEGRLFSSSLTKSKKGDDSCLLVVFPMKRICNQCLIVRPQIDRHSQANICHGVLARLELLRHVLCWTLMELEFGIV